MSNLADRIGASIDREEQRNREREEALAANRARIVLFLRNVALPAFEDLRTEFEQKGRVVNVSSHAAPSDGAWASIQISRQSEHKEFPDLTFLEVRYTIHFNVTEKHVTPIVKTWDGKSALESLIRGKSPDDIDSISHSDITEDVLRRWDVHRLMRQS